MKAYDVQKKEELEVTYDDLMKYIDSNRQVDLVFSDVVMPEISGIALAGKLAQTEHPPQVILMSDIPGLSLRTWNIRALAFMPKPYTRKDVRDMLSLAKEKA